VKDINGKALRREHYLLLKKLGIEIVMYDLKIFPDQLVGGMHQPAASSMGFEIYGGLDDKVDFDQLLEYLRILLVASETENPAIKDALEHLQLVIGIANE
jgi:hypothetical protein